jgi:hypothetical protein
MLNHLKTIFKLQELPSTAMNNVAPNHALKQIHQTTASTLLESQREKYKVLLVSQQEKSDQLKLDGCSLVLNLVDRHNEAQVAQLEKQTR